MSDQQPRSPSLWQDGFGQLATRCIQTLALLALSAVALLLIVQLRLVLVPVIVALILASALNPIMRRFRAWNFPSALAAAIVLVSILVLFALIAWLVSWTVVNQWDDLVESAQAGLDQIREQLTNLPFEIDDAQLQEWREKLTEFATSGQVGAGALQGVSTAAHIATGAVLIVVVLFFFLKDGPAIWEFVLRPFTGEQYGRAKRIGRHAVQTLGGYARGTTIVAAVDAIGIGIGLLILKVPLAVPLTVIVFLTAFIPLIGAIVASALAALVGLVANGPMTALIIILIAIAVNQLEGNLLQPVVMSKSVNLHALAILMALTAGTILGGILGALLAVPIAAVTWRIISVWNGDDTPARPFQQKRVESS